MYFDCAKKMLSVCEKGCQGFVGGKKVGMKRNNIFIYS